MKYSHLSCSVMLVTTAYMIFAIFAASAEETIQSVKINPRQDGSTEEELISTIQTSQGSVQTLTNVGTLIAHIFKQLGELPVSVINTLQGKPLPSLSQLNATSVHTPAQDITLAPQIQTPTPTLAPPIPVVVVAVTAPPPQQPAPVVVQTTPEDEDGDDENDA